MTLDDERRAILSQVAAGTLDPTHAAHQLAELDRRAAAEAPAKRPGPHPPAARLPRRPLRRLPSTAAPRRWWSKPRCAACR